MRFYLLVFLLLGTFQIGRSQITSQTDFSIGKTIQFQSEILKENRTLNIYLPDSYHVDSTKNYPVIYLLDGSRDEDFIHISGLVQFCSFSWINIIEESIVVGIGNVDRKKDFTYPSTIKRDNDEFPTTGHSENFIKFIGDELQNLISKEFRINNSKTLIGQSLGGLLATEILFKRPDLFDNYIIVSPSLWWDGENLLKHTMPKSIGKKSIYVGVGQEGQGMEELAQRLYDKLSAEKKVSQKLFFQYFEKQDHGDVLHLAAYDALEKLFKKEEKEEK